MADYENAKLDHENHLLLDQPLLRLPVELLRKNFRSAHFELERDSKYLRDALKETATAAVSGISSGASTETAATSSTEAVLRNLDSMIERMRGTKRKLAGFAEEEQRLYRHEGARARHLAEIYAMQGVEDVRYEAWSRVRLDRMLVDYLLRRGHGRSARLLAHEKGIEELVDVETFEQMARIRESLLRGSVAEALAWCTAGDTKKELRKMDSNLEFMLRYQQYIELVRPYTPTKLSQAIQHAQKWLYPYRATHAHEVQQACGLLAVPPSRASSYPAYADLYSPRRWRDLASLFVTTHNRLLSLPAIPSLHMALSAGLSALKTPACHSISTQQSADAAAALVVSSSSTSTTTPASSLLSIQNKQQPPAGNGNGNGNGNGVAGSGVSSIMASMSPGGGMCPICSRELNALARGVPYAHHTKSHVEPDLVLLPNGRVYGRERLEEYARKTGGLLDGQVKDLRTGEVFDGARIRRVFIT